MALTTFSGPVHVGPNKETSGDGSIVVNQGNVVLNQSTTISQTATGTKSATILLPTNAQITSITVDVLTQWTSTTSSALTVGTVALGAQYVTSIDATTATTGRQAITFTGAQVVAMTNIGTNTNVVTTVASVGATTTGAAFINVYYVQN